MPEIPFGIDLLASSNSKADWHMHIMSTPASDCHSCFAGHCGMNSVLCQMRTIDAVVGISGYSSNHVARIDIFEPHVKRPFLKIFLDMSLEYNSNPISLNRILPDGSVFL